MLCRLLMGKESKWSLASSPSRDTRITCRETKGMENCVVLVLQQHFSGRTCGIKNPPAVRTPQLNHTTCFGWAVSIATEGKIQLVSMVGGAGVQLRLNQPTWLLSGPHDNPLRGPGAVDAVALLLLCCFALLHRPWERWWPAWGAGSGTALGWSGTIAWYGLCPRRGGRESVGLERLRGVHIGCPQGRPYAQAKVSTGAS